MAQVRRELGPDAVIVATGDAPGGGVEVRAAAEGPRFAAPEEPARARAGRLAEAAKRARGDAAEGLARIEAALVFHGAPDHARDAILSAAEAFAGDAAAAMLAGALEARYAFRPLPPVPERALLFAGAPGTGKTSALARSAARAVAAGVRPVLVSADAERAGAEARLRELAGRLQAEFIAVDDPRELEREMARIEAGPVFIDAPAVNPFEIDDLDMLAGFAAAGDAEIIPVLDGGGAAADAEDIAAMLASLGAMRMMLAKLDCARRLGAVLGAGEAGLAFAQVSASPYIGAGLAPATPLRLARLLLDERGLPDEAFEDETMQGDGGA